MDAVMHVRLMCATDLQSALDARLTVQQWMSLSLDGMLDEIESLVTSSTNQAVLWDVFFSGHQTPGESMKEYFNKCLQQAIDCKFSCPNCTGDLSEYILVRKIMVGLHDPVLKRELYQFLRDTRSITLEELKAHCVAFESASRDAQGGKSNVFGAAVDLEEEEPPVEVTAGVRRKTTGTPRVSLDRTEDTTCGNCGKNRAPNRRTCPARDAVCWGCQNKGHFSRCCKKGAFKNKPRKSFDKDESSGSLGAVRVSSARSSRLPKLEVEVSAEGTERWSPAVAVADTGAEVCVAGPQHLRLLGLREGQLLEVDVGLLDIAEVRVKVMGFAWCVFRIGKVATRQRVYFVKSSKMLFLSLNTCISLKLVPCDFPFHTRMVAGVIRPTHPPPLIRPSSPPYPPVEENVGRMQDWLLQHFSSTTFNTSRYPLPAMKGPAHHIHLERDAKPVAYHTPLTVPKHWETEVKKQLDEDVKRGVIKPVAAGEATEWCSRMVVTSKKNGQPRRTVDYQPLNAVCRRETHHTPAPFDMVSNVPGHTYKTVADAFSGFHQVELDEESQKLTTFITPWGRYQYLRTPMGHCAAPDAYTKRFDDAIAGIERKYKCIDDTLLYDESVEKSFWHTYDFLEMCANSGVTLNPEKFAFCRREVEFVGYDLGWESYHPSSDRLAAVRDFPMPLEPTITDIRAWHGLVNQLAPFMATAPVMAPFRDLLKKPTKKKVYWDEVLRQKYEEAKGMICRLAKDGLRYYDKSLPTAAVTDWSREGIGFVILQQYCQCVSADTPFCCKGGWRLALCGSRQLTATEAGYAAVEGEALAVVWCLRKARLFLLGCPNLLLVTDHRPLVKLFGNRELKDIANPRLFRMKEKTLQFRFQVKYLPGKRNCAADTLSRYPVLQTSPEKEDLDFNDDVTVAMATATTAALGEELNVVMDQDTVASAAQDDPVYQLLISRVSSNDWPRSKAQEIECLRPFFSVRDRLSVTDNLVTYTFEEGSVRLVVPEAVRDQIASNLHSGHQGLDSMLRRARHSVYWPGMDGDLQYYRSKCDTCELHAPSQGREPVIMTPPPEYPFQRTVADLFQLDNRMYLAYADRLTGWVEVAHLPNGATSNHLIKKFRQYFVRWGSPEELATDGGTNLTSEEMAAFLRRWGIALRVSSAHYPQSNGRAEAGVRVAKRIVRDNIGVGGSLDTDRAAQALLQYLNTPLHGEDKSPAQLAAGRQLRDSVPMAKQHYKIDQHWRKTLRQRELQMARKNERVEEKYDEGASPLTPLEEGQRVRIQDPSTKLWDRKGVIVEAARHRQYKVRLDGSGRMSLRNRRHLRVTSSPTSSLGAPQAALPSPQSPLPVPQVGGRPRPTRSRQQPRWLQDYV